MSVLGCSVCDMKNLIVGIAQSLSWSLSLGNKFFRVVPGCTGITVIATIFSQFFLLAGFLLPLKVVLLLGADHVPHYFPMFLQAVGRDRLIILLSVVSVIFYLLHLITAKVVDYCSKFGAEKLLAKSKKMAIFENQEDIALRGYQRYSQSLASFCFLLICLLGMLFFYSALALVIFVYFIISIAVVGLALSTVSSFKKRILDSLGALPKILGGIGFLFSFAFIVFDYLAGHSPGLLIAVISLLLARQLFGRVSSLIKDQYDLYRQKAQLSALFFHGNIFQAEAKSKTRGMWPLIEPNIREQWVGKVVAETLGLPKVGFSSHWVQMGLPDVLCYLVKVKLDSGLEKDLLVKLFNVNRSSWAKHEATLLTTQDNIPALPFLCATTVEGMNCHVFEATDYRCCTGVETAKAQMDFRAALAACSPSTSLVSLYIRSRTRLWQRLDDDLLCRLEWLLRGDSDPVLFDRFRSVLQNMRQTLENLPHSIFVQDVRPGMLWISPDGSFVLANWGRWEFEPLGTRWTFTDKEADRIAGFFRGVQSARHPEEVVSISQLKFSALIYDFVFFMQRARYIEAYGLIEKILITFDEVKL